MELLIIETLLWIGFGFLLWAMRDSLTRIEREVELCEGRWRAAHLPQLERTPTRFPLPQRLLDPIGQYRGQPIHDYAIIEGRRYRFAYVCAPPESLTTVCDHPGHQWVAPGLVYVECAAPLTGPSAA